MRILLVVLVCTTAALASPPNPNLSAGIGIEELKGHVKTLASDDFQGRRPGTPGGELAAKYIAERFAEIGLTPIGDDGTHFQKFDLPVRRQDPKASALTFRNGETKESFAAGTDWRAFPSSDTTEIADAEVVFAGYGLTAPRVQYDDYAGLDVKGKVVLILRHGPREGMEGALFGKKNRPYVTFSAKARSALKAGARAVVLVNDSLHTKDDRLVVPMMNWGMPKSLPFLFAKKHVAEKLLASVGKDFLAVQKGIDETNQPASFPLEGVRLSLKLTMSPVRSANVVGFLEGSDEKRKNEIVVVGGHYDHLGTDGRGSLDRAGKGAIWNGADDNASGTTGVIELAEHVALSASKPKRSYLFIAFTGEEMGLLGSRHYVANPLMPLERTVAMFNLDMIGRMSEGRLFIGGVGTSPEFDRFITEAAEGLELDILRGRGGAAPSDNTPFFRKRMPTLFFFTGIHKDYHRETDTWDKLNYEGQKMALTVASKVLWLVDGLAERPAFVNARTAFLGVQFDRRDEGPGALLARVVSNAPAAMAGLKAGDRVIAFAGKPVKDAGELTKAIRARIGGEEVDVKVKRGEEELTFKLKLGAR